MHNGNKMKTLLSLPLLAAVLVSAAWAGPDARTVDTARLHAMIMDNAYRLEGGREQRFVIVDARTRKEFDEAHIFSAISIPEDAIGRSAHLLPGDKNALIVVYDNGGSAGIGRRWAERAAAAGYANVVVYTEGFSAWKKKRLPMVLPKPDAAGRK